LLRNGSSERPRSHFAIGFVQGNDGTLTAPKDSCMRLVPTGQFYELKISLGEGDTVVAVLSKAAIKIIRESKP
jgi:hypothetical protein